MTRPRYALFLPILLFPVAIFMLAGVAKLVSPSTTPPQLLEWFPAASYAFAMRGLGAFECVLAGALLFSRTRFAAACVSLVMLAAFSVFAVLSSHDRGFAENCGCFGELSFLVGGSSTLAVLLRNSALAGALLTVAPLSGATSGSRLRIALGIALIWLLTGLYASEANRRLHTERVTRGLFETIDRKAEWPMPNVQLRTLDGMASQSNTVLREGDLMVFFSPTCPHCGDLAQRWVGLAKRLKDHEQRLVLISVDSGPTLEDFIDAHDLRELATYVLANLDDQIRLGIWEVPTMMQLGADRRITFSEQQQQTAAFVMSDPPGLTIASGSSRPALATTLALRIDAHDVIESAKTVAAGGYVQAIDPRSRLVETLPGLHVTSAAQMASHLAEEPTVEAPIWRSIGETLATVIEARQAKKGKGRLRAR